MAGVFLSLIVSWVVSSVLVLKDRSKPTLVTCPKSITLEKSPFGIEINEMNCRIEKCKIYYYLEGLL